MHDAQFYGTAAVMDIYADMGLPQFAFFQGKEFVVAGNSDDELEKWCKRFESSGGTAKYKFRLYEQVSGPIKPATDYVCSFDVAFSQPYMSGMGAVSPAILARMDKIEKQLGAGDGTSTMDRIGDAVLGWLEEPDKLVSVLSGFKALLTGAQLPAAGVAGMTEPSRIITPDQEDKAIRLASALDSLEKADPLILPHLEKLAKIAVSQPGTFKTLVGMIDSF